MNQDASSGSVCLPRQALEEAPECPQCGTRAEWRERGQIIAGGVAAGHANWYCTERACPNGDPVQRPDDDDDEGPHTPTERSPRTSSAALPPGIMRDLVERQAMRGETQEERIRRVLTAAGALEGSSTTPGILLSRNGDGRVIVRWGMKRADGTAVSCAWTEAAEQALETACRELEEEGIPACVGAPGVEGMHGAERAEPAEPTAGWPTEAAARIEELEAQIDTLTATLDRIQLEVESLRPLHAENENLRAENNKHRARIEALVDALVAMRAGRDGLNE